MPSRTCPYCETKTHMTPKWGELKTFRGLSILTLQGALTCDHCGRASFGFATTYGGNNTTPAVDKWKTTADENITWIPRKGVSPEFPDVPEQIARAAREAHASFSINSFMAAILVARTVVEATAKEKGITSGNLLSKIDAMAKQSVIRDDTKDAAHEIRHLGNDMAHGDIKDVPAAEDVEDVLVLMDEILAEVFQGPARTARLKNRRNATT